MLLENTKYCIIDCKYTIQCRKLILHLYSCSKLPGIILTIICEEQVGHFPVALVKEFKVVCLY